MYDYHWVYTSAQIELMNADAPFIAYKKRNKKDEGNPSDGGTEPTKESCEETVRKWQERRKKRRFKMQDFLNGKYGASEKSNSQENDITE